jgi:hypothetical protein
MSVDRTTLTVSACGLVALVTGFVVLAETGNDTSAYVLFVSGPLVSTLVGALLVRKVSVVKKVAEDVRKQTNGIITMRLNTFDQKFLDAQESREEIAGRPTAAKKPD